MTITAPEMTAEQFTAACATAEFTFSRTRQGEWVICGPADLLHIAAESRWQIPVTKKNGDTVEKEIERVGKTFGDGLAYGTPADETPRVSRNYRRATTRRSTTNTRTFYCPDCQRRVREHSECWETGRGHYSN